MRTSDADSKPTSEKPPLTVSGATMRDAFEAFALAHEMRQRGIPVCALHVDSSEDATQGNNSAPAQSENVHHEADKSPPAESEIENLNGSLQVFNSGQPRSENENLGISELVGNSGSPDPAEPVGAGREQDRKAAK